MTINPIALASGVLPEYGAADVVEAAGGAGFDLVGLTIDPETWTDRALRDTKDALARTGLPVVDVEVLWLKDGAKLDDHLRILDAGAEFGAANALCVSSDPDAGRTADWLAKLCRYVEGSPMRIALEFGIFTQVSDLSAASAIVAQVDHPAMAILIDPIHVDRSGTTAAQIAALDPNLLPYAQFCDAPAQRPDPADFDAVIIDAIDLRRQCGKGDLDLAAIYRALPPGIPLSIELRSAALREAFPDDPTGRAREVARATRKWLETMGQETVA